MGQSTERPNHVRVPRLKLGTWLQVLLLQVASFLGPAAPRREWTVEEAARLAARKEFELLQLLSTDKKALTTASSAPGILAARVVFGVHDLICLCVRSRLRVRRCRG